MRAGMGGCACVREPKGGGKEAALPPPTSVNTMCTCPHSLVRGELPPPPTPLPHTCNTPSHSSLCPARTICDPHAARKVGGLRDASGAHLSKLGRVLHPNTHTGPSPRPRRAAHGAGHQEGPRGPRGARHLRRTQPCARRGHHASPGTVPPRVAQAAPACGSGAVPPRGTQHRRGGGAARGTAVPRGARPVTLGVNATRACPEPPAGAQGARGRPWGAVPPRGTQHCRGGGAAGGTRVPGAAAPAAARRRQACRRAVQPPRTGCTRRRTSRTVRARWT